MKFIIAILCLLPLISTAQADDPTPLNGWGFDVGLGNQSYVEDIFRVSGFTPYLFSWGKQTNHSRLVLDVSNRDFQNFSDSVKAVPGVTLSLKSESNLFKGLISSYSKIGLGVLLIDDEIYNSTLFTLPISIGMNVLTSLGDRDDFGASTFYVEYQFNNILNYDNVNSLPSQPNTFIDGDIFSTNTLFVGFQVIF